MELGLKGKRAVVLAASRGLGYACALGLAREGCKLVICSRTQERIEQAAAQIRQETGAEVHAVAADVKGEADIQKVVQACVEQYGGIEIVVHNAGGPPAGNFQTINDDQWNTAFQQNLMSFVWLARAAIPEMKKAGYGRILAITSSSIKQPIPNLILSNVMRAGVLALAKSLSSELAPSNILVNIVGPGRIATERIEELDKANAQRTNRSVEDVRTESIKAIPLGRLGDPEELANMVVFLASEAASYISGTSTLIDGAKSDSLL
ncbi:MAG TPA: SDR family oxidoreductase [Roseiflexaceae bacterium]|jgi:3-oxoacyl-[acyl-carrier protein] reductase|nr:SDR family oxidoreductase [Roseiflexaceae bacterium]